MNLSDQPSHLCWLYSNVSTYVQSALTQLSFVLDNMQMSAEILILSKGVCGCDVIKRKVLFEIVTKLPKMALKCRCAIIMHLSNKVREVVTY